MDEKIREVIVDDKGRPTGNGLDIGYRGLGLRATGPLAILALVFVLMGGLLAWIGHQGFQGVQVLLTKAVLDHSEMVNSQDRLSCVVSLSSEERTILRRGTSETFYSLCPWMRR